MDAPLTPDFKIEPLESGFRLPRFSVPIKIGIVAVVVLIVAVFVVLGFRGSSFSQNNVTVTVSGAAQASSGDEVTYTVHYKNANRVALTDASLTFYYPPDSVIFEGGKMSDRSNATIELGTIEANAEGEKTFTMLVVGAQGDIKSARAALQYTPTDLTTELKVTGEATTEIHALAIPLSVVVPETVVGGQSIAYIIEYTNQSGEDFSSLRVRAKFPEGFRATSFDPAAAHAVALHNQEEYWEVPTLGRGEQGRISIEGVLEGREREGKTLSVTLQKRISGSTGLTYINFEKAEGTSTIATPLLSVETNLENGPDYVAHLHDRLQYRVTVRNNTDADLSNLTLKTTLEGVMYDTVTIQSSGFFDSRARSILWTSAVIPELGLLRAHGSVEIPFDIYIKSAFPGGGLGSADSFVKATAVAQTSDVPDYFHGSVLSAQEALITRVSTAPTFGQRLNPQDAQFGALGPYPPRVDHETAFTVRWTLTNPSNDLIPAKVTAVLMPGVMWKKQVRVEGVGSQPVYNAKTSTVTWDLSAVPAGAGVTNPAYEAYFQISVVPSLNQLNSSVPLMKSIQFEGTDSITKEKITRTISDTGTIDIENRRAAGVVQP